MKEFPKGYEIHRGWKKGAKIRRRTGLIVTLTNDGQYMHGGSYALWYFGAIRENGTVDSICPEEGDEPIGGDQ